MLLGVLNGLGFLFQKWALAYTTAGKAAFIASIYCAMIPFVKLAHLQKKKTSWNQYFAAFMRSFGIGLISLGTDFHFSGLGEQMTLLSAIILPSFLCLAAELAHKYDIITLTVVQRRGAFLLPTLCFETVPNFCGFAHKCLGLPSPTSLLLRPH